MKRQVQVGKLIQRELSRILLKDGSSLYRNALVTVVEVRLTRDLGKATIYLSIYNTADKTAVMEAIKNRSKEIRSELAGAIRKQVRRIPEIAFYLDETLDQVYRIEQIFKDIKGENTGIPG